MNTGGIEDGNARLSSDGLFYTLQGEGPFVGVPSVFVRLNVCNLKCKWGETLCDAKYTSWNPQGGTVLKTRELLDRLEGKMLEHQCWFVVLTGGEPTLQPDVVQAIGCRVHSLNSHTTLETNGTRFVPTSQMDLVCLSPKLRGSTPVGTPYEKVHERNRWNPEAVRAWMESEIPFYFKFVIDSEADIDEACQMLDEVEQPVGDAEHVLFMPQGVNAAQLWERGRWLAERCKDLGVRFTSRMQIDLWGDKPGT